LFRKLNISNRIKIPRGVAMSQADEGWIFLEGCNPWTMEEHGYARLGLAPCPVCEGKTLGRKVYCLGCDRTGLDGKVTFPGLGVDEASDPDWDESDWIETGRQVA
jgi:hypothetical protein